MWNLVPVCRLHHQGTELSILFTTSQRHLVAQHCLGVTITDSYWIFSSKSPVNRIIFISSDFKISRCSKHHRSEVIYLPKYIIDILLYIYYWYRLPWWLRWWKICLQCRRPGFNPWVGKIPWRRESLPTPVFLRAGGEGGDSWMRWLDGIMTQWTWVWANSRRWWRTGKPDMLQSMGSQRVGHNSATEQQQLMYFWWYLVIRHCIKC